MFAGRGSFLWADRVSRAERGRGGWDVLEIPCFRG